MTDADTLPIDGITVHDDGTWSSEDPAEQALLTDLNVRFKALQAALAVWDTITDDDHLPEPTAVSYRADEVTGARSTTLVYPHYDVVFNDIEDSVTVHHEGIEVDRFTPTARWMRALARTASIL